jgi:4-hydroxythreonine-4-phosphate dehydrogenase
MLVTVEDRIIALTMGDPAGVGPEIILKSLVRSELSRIPVVVIGSMAVLEKVRDLLDLGQAHLASIPDVADAAFEGSRINVLDVSDIEMDKLESGKPQAIAGHTAFECLKRAIDLALGKKVAAIVTAPLNKEALHLAGHHFAGHTEILAHFTNSPDVAMLLYTETLKVIHATTHLSLREAIESLTPERIGKVVRIAHDFLQRLGTQAPRIAVAGLNPHAGEGGLFGDEEADVILPAIKQARSEGLDVTGPEPPDTVFLQAHEGQYDIVVAMYHDQGHVPVKLLGFHSGVNVTAGLSIIRTSVDHGTAFDIAWKGEACEGSMIEAILLASQLAAKT